VSVQKSAPWGMRRDKCVQLGSGRSMWIASTVAIYAVEKGDVVLLPAVAGACAFRPNGEVNLLEIAIPE
jgi:hypothetical protein